MATVLGAHLSPLELESRMFTISAQASYDKIVALESVIDANLEADYLFAEYTVLREGGDMNDLELLYMEAENQAAEKKQGVISKALNWITTNMSKFFGWLSNLFGKKMENIDPNAQVQVNSFDKQNANIILRAWNKVKSWFNTMFNNVKNNTPVSGLDVAKVLTGFGLGMLTDKGLQSKRQKEDNGATETMTGAEMQETVGKLRQIQKTIDEWMDKFRELANQYGVKVEEEAQRIRQKKDMKKLAKAEAKANANNNSGGETTESTITAEDLFGDYFTEAKNKAKQGKPEDNTSRQSGTAAKTDNSKKPAAKSNTTTTGNTNGIGGQPANNNGTATGSKTNTTADATDDGKKPEANNNGGGEKTDSGNANQNTDQNKADTGDGKPEPSKADWIQAFISVGGKTLMSFLHGLFETCKNLAIKFANKVRGKNKNAETPETGDGAGDGSGEQTDGQEPQQPTEESTMMDLFGMDESEFDYLNEMSEEDKADLEFLWENL